MTEIYRRDFLKLISAGLGSVSGFVFPPSAASGMVSVRYPESIMGSFGFGATLGASARLTSACGSTPVSNSPEQTKNGIPSIDVSGVTVENKNIIPLQKNFVTVSSSVEYEELFWRKLDESNFFDNSNHDSLYINEWRIRNNVDRVNDAILRDFAKGPTAQNDLIKPQNWQVLGTTGGDLDPQLHWNLLQSIGEKGLDGDVRIIGYFDDIGQRPESNIIRQVFVVEKEGKRFFIKVLNAEEAINEAGALIKLQEESPGTRVSNTTIFKLNKTPTSRVSIVVSDAIVTSSGHPAPTIETYISNGNRLNTAQKNQLLDIYSAAVRSYVDTDESVVLEADLLKLANIVVDDSTGDLIVVDAFSTQAETQIYEGNKGILRSTNKSLDKSLELMRSQLRIAGFTQEEITTVEQQLALANQKRLGTVINPGEFATFDVIDDETKALIERFGVQNDLGEDPIIIPKTITAGFWEKLNTGLNITMTVLGGIALGSEIANKLLSGDEKYEIPQHETMSSDYWRRGMPIDTFMNVYGQGRNIDIPYYLAHTVYTINIEDLKTMIIRHKKAISLREGLNLPSGAKALKLFIDQIATPVIIPEGLEMYADLLGDDQRLKISAKSPSVLIKDGNPLIGLISVDMLEFKNSGEDSIKKRRKDFNDFDISLSDEINFYLPSKEKWKVLEKLKEFYDNGLIDFMTISDSGHIIYGCQLGDEIEFRYLAYEDNTQRLYKGEDGKTHFPKKAVTINDLVNM